jgi:hypothetical protein
MATPVSFSVFDFAGVPTNAPSPAFVAIKDRLGNTLPTPTITNLGSLGTYSFDMVDGGYLISTTSLPPYVMGGVGDDGVYTALFEMSGTPKTNATPTVALTDWAGSALPTPGVANLGGGLYYFPVPGPCCYLMTTGCNPEYLTGSVETGTPIPPVAPTMPRMAPTTATPQPARDIHVDLKTGKFYQFKGDLVLVSGMNAVQQAVLLALNAFIGTYWLDTGYGVDYFNNILGKHPKEVVLSVFRSAILNVEGVLGVPSIEYSLTSNRLCSVTVKVQSNDGVFTLSTTVGS